MPMKDLQKILFAFAIEIAFVKSVEKTKKKKEKKKDKKKKKKKRKEQRREKSIGRRRRRRRGGQRLFLSDKDKDDEDDDDDEDEKEDKDDSSSNSDDSDNKKEEVASSSRLKRNRIAPVDKKEDNEYVIEKVDEGADLVSDKDGKIKTLEWTVSQIVSVDKLPKGKFLWTIRKLKPRSVYLLRMRAKNSSGWGLYSFPATQLVTKDCDIESKILKPKEQEMLSKWMPKKYTQKKWKLLLRASKDGFDSATFHRKCDNKGPTVVIVHSHLGHVFGGYVLLLLHSEKEARYERREIYLF
ncbi:hypothetical protein RFI_24186 [Reticulomyxa filosa]|uniref:Oxidation resistance protein 1 n=1 Tax=Reticulomyxa filosa TaxID=46433 RepID=X6MJE7_RETFI|nr:hypothetical protein RFI_24186 [Reticulomyxa filosa]|eukprot:ETO13190.1 hypothetical protein RFI_24186 [Reticulomyxa filosa]